MSDLGLDLKFAGGTLISGGDAQPRDVGVAGGKVVGLYPPGEAPAANRTLDANGLWILPGFIDTHFHCRAPDRPDREDFESGTRAAAAGGVTTVFEMPFSKPSVHSVEVFERRRRLAETQAHVDFALWAGGVLETAAGYKQLADAGAIGFKMLLHSPPLGREAEFVGTTALDHPALMRALERIAPTGLPAAVHSEDGALIDFLVRDLKSRGEVGPYAHEASRPSFVEAIAVATVLFIAEFTQTRLHFPHITTARAVELIAAAQARGQSVTLETCPHYLFYDLAVMEHAGPYGKINPPIRRRVEQQGLWKGIADGTVTNVASDHAPYLPEEKEPGWHEIFAAPSGCPGVEMLGPSLLDAAVKGRLSASRVASLLSEGPAVGFAVNHRKGFVQVGMDADLVLFDPNDSWTVDVSALHSRSGESARLYQGRTFAGRIVATYVRGTSAFERGEIKNEAGTGQFIAPDERRSPSTKSAPVERVGS